MLTRPSIFFIVLFLLPLGHSEEYCLSGGFSSDFNCDDPQLRIDANRYFSLTELKACLKQNQADPYICYQDQAANDKAGDVSFSVQLLEQKDETGISQHQDVLYISELSDNKKLVYLGSYQDKTQALAALDEAAATWGEVHKPMLVEFRATGSLPKIRFIAEADYSHSDLTTAPPVPQPPIGPAVIYPATTKIYALQMAAYNNKDDAVKFANRYHALNLLCRRKDNGLYSVYHSAHSNKEEATTVLLANKTLKKLGAYVTLLQEVQFEQCNSWSNGAIAAKQPSPPPSKNTQKLVFSIQTAAFNNLAGSDIFINRHKYIRLECRLKSNGMFAVYYGQFGNYGEAKLHLADHGVFKKLGAYIVKLSDVEFNNCKVKS